MEAPCVFLKTGSRWTRSAWWRESCLPGQERLPLTECMQTTTICLWEIRSGAEKEPGRLPAWWHFPTTAACFRITTIPCLMLWNLGFLLWLRRSLILWIRKNCNTIIPGSMTKNRRQKRKRKKFPRIWWRIWERLSHWRLLYPGIWIRPLLLQGMIWVETRPWWSCFFILLWWSWPLYSELPSAIRYGKKPVLSVPYVRPDIPDRNWFFTIWHFRCWLLLWVHWSEISLDTLY